MKLKPSYETETYLSGGGYYAIKQFDGIGEEQIVILDKNQARKVMDDIKLALKEDWEIEEL